MFRRPAGFRRRFPGVRRYGARRRFGARRFGGRRRQMSVKKRVIGASARAAKTNYVQNSMCRDLGTLWPSCLITKIRWHAMLQAHSANSNDTLNNSGTNFCYDNTINLWPQTVTAGPVGFLAVGAYASGSTVAWQSATGFAPNTTIALGVGRLLGASGAGASAVYTKMCVLKSQIMLDGFFAPFVAEETKATPPAKAADIHYPGVHFFHPMSNLDSRYNAPVDAPTESTFHMQPDVSRKTSGRVTGVYTSGNFTDTQTGAIPPMGVVLPGHSVKWRKVIWPHKLLDMSFTDYVSDQNSFGTSVALPARFAGFQFSGLFHAPSGTGTSTYVPRRGSFRCTIISTVLLKDIVGVLT